MKKIKIGLLNVLLIVTLSNKAQEFASLSTRIDGGYYKLASNYIYFKIYGQYNTATLLFNIYDKSHTIIASNSLNASVINSTSIKAGHNEYSINCNSSSIFPTGYYILEIINEKNEKFYLRFKK